MCDSSPIKEAYLQKETDKLNHEVSKLLDEIRVRERYGITTVAIVGAWFFEKIILNGEVCQKDLGTWMIFLCCIVFLMILIYGVSVYFLYLNIGWIGNYLGQMENYFLGKPLEEGFEFGWEKYFNSRKKRKLMVKLSVGLWFFYLALSIALALIILRYR